MSDNLDELDEMREMALDDDIRRSRSLQFLEEEMDVTPPLTVSEEGWLDILIRFQQWDDEVRL